MLTNHIDTGSQPLVNDDKTIALAVNGEIYNHRILRKSLDSSYHYKTHSDCEVIIPLVCSSDTLLMLFSQIGVDNIGSI